MITRTWKPLIDNQTHTILLKHNEITGGFSVQVDGKTAASRKTAWKSWDTEFDIAGHRAKLFGNQKNFSFEYELWIEGEDSLVKYSVSPLEKDQLNKKTESVFWKNLANQTGLEYLPVPGSSDELRHRLVGELSGYLIVVKRHFYQQQNALFPAVVIVIRHNTPLDLELVRRQIQDDVKAENFLGKIKGQIKEMVGIEQGYTSFILRYDFKVHEAESILAQRLQTALAITAKYVKPLSKDTCEIENCSGQTDLNPSKLVFINGFPTYAHSSCLPRLQTLGEKNRQRYRETPSGLINFIFAGLGLVFVTGMVYTTIAFISTAIILEREWMAKLVGLVMFFILLALPVLLIRLRVYLQTKMGLLSSAIVVSYAVVGVYWSEFLHSLWKYWETLNHKPLFDLLSTAWELATRNNKLLPQLLIMVLLTSLFLEISVVLGTRERLSTIFKPAIEIYQPPVIPSR